jgi:hypothetical protein
MGIGSGCWAVADQVWCLSLQLCVRKVLFDVAADFAEFLHNL